MTKEEAKDFLFGMFNLIGTTALEHWTEKDAEKMRQAVLTIENESAQPEQDKQFNMAEFISTEEKVVNAGDPVIFENNTDSDFSVSAAIVFRKSGLYDVSIEGRRIIVSKVAERKKGHWNITDAYPHNVYCSECYKKYAQTHWAVWEDGSLPRNFCPNCGAYMRGEQDE